MKLFFHILTIILIISLLSGCDHDREKRDTGFIERMPHSLLAEEIETAIIEGDESSDLQERTAEYYIPDYKPERGTRISAPGHIGAVSLITGYPVVTGPDKRGFGFSPCINVPEPVLSVSFDNDIFANTDYYYTSGLEISLFHPFISHLPGTALLPGTGINSTDHYGLRIIQNLYTPIDPDQHEIQYGDRPFASYLLIGIQRVSLNPGRSVKVRSGIDLGIIGPGAFGGTVQKTVHRFEPVGWSNQITNDIVINYHLLVDKGLIIRKGFELWATLEGSAGTLYDNLGGGFSVKAGIFEPTQSTLTLVDGTNCRKLQFYVSAGVNNKVVFYDATLQGGMFNNTSVYSIPSSNLSRYVFNASMGVGFAYGRYGLHFTQNFNTAEFKGAKNHSWGRIGLEFRL